MGKNKNKSKTPKAKDQTSAEKPKSDEKAKEEVVPKVEQPEEKKMDEVKEAPKSQEQSQVSTTVPSSRADAPKDKQEDVTDIADQMADFADMLGGGFSSDEDEKKPPAKKPEPAKKVEVLKTQPKMDESEFEKIDVSQTK
jgi:hypothetical protein